MNAQAPNSFSWQKALMLCFVVAVLTLGFSIFLQTRGVNAQFLATGATQLVAAPAQASAGTSFQVPGTPVRLVIPSIHVDAKVQSVGLAWQGTGDMGIPTNFTDVGWYNGGPRPGEPGSAVIDGHLDGKNVPQAVFYNLDKLQTGDLVEVIDSKGQTLTFKVVATKTYDYNAPTGDIFSSDVSSARLNLITCAGDWDASEKIYNKRIVVFTELVSS